MLGQAANLNTVTEQYQIGFYYSTDSEPGPSNGVYAASVYTDTEGSFYAELSDLESETQYFYVAVIQVGNELIFGDEIRSFMTEEAKPEVAEPVDLGLSVKWASWNLGAGSPEEIGGLYAIGELQPKEEFTWENYQVSTDISGCFSATKYDAAFNLWGKDWRLPTEGELSELRYNCNLTYTEQNGVKGLLVTGPNGNSIFLPDPYVSYRGTYLSGNCQDNSVFTLYFREYYTDAYYNSYRCFGFPIRPVYSPGIKDMSIETFDATNIKVYSATITGKIEDPHWANLTEVGFYYNTTGNPHEGNGEYISLGGRSSTSEFNFNFKDLTPSTTYYYVAAARLFDDIFYGDEKTFTTVKYNEVPTSGQKIDLGLSVKWAGWNIGATSPSGCGNYYPWGVTQERSYLDYYSYEHRPTSDDPGADYKDIGSNISGTKYDVARVKWGGTWRIPTKEEFNELIEKCTIEARTYDGMPGSLFTGPNGNSIFLPEAGEKWQSTVREKNKSGWYWSANEEKGYRNMSAGFLWVANDNAHYSDMNKVTGLTIRPVCDD